ncbi:MAG: hypothetical protein ACEPOV_12050 [Hyphomicrobiales bacterium]
MHILFEEGTVFIGYFTNKRRLSVNMPINGSEFVKVLAKSNSYDDK